MSDQPLFWPDRLAYLGAGVLLGGVLSQVLFGGGGDAGPPTAPDPESAPTAASPVHIERAPPPAQTPDEGRFASTETTVAPIVAETPTANQPPVAKSEAPLALDDGDPLPKPESPLDRWLQTSLPADPLVCYLFDETRPLRKPISGRLMRPVKVPNDIKPGQTLSREDARRLARVLRASADMDLQSEGPVVRHENGVQIKDGGKLVSLEAGRALAERLSETDAFSLVTYLSPADMAHTGPARIISLSWDGQTRNFTLGQERDKWIVRVRTTENDNNGCAPELSYPGLTVQRSLVVVTFGAAGIHFYLNGVEVPTAQPFRGNLRGWDRSYPLVIGNEYRDARNWAGSVRLVAFYDRQLSAKNVAALADTQIPGDPPLGALPPAVKNPPVEKGAAREADLQF